MAEVLRLKIPSADIDLEQWELPYTSIVAAGGVSWYKHSRKLFGSAKHTHILCPNNSHSTNIINKMQTPVHQRIYGEYSL